MFACVWAWYFESLSIKKIDHYLGCRAEGRATNSINQVLLTINKKSILIRNEFYLISNKTQGKWQTSLVHNCHNRIALVSVIGQMHTTDCNAYPKSRLHILEQSVCSNIHYTLGKVVTTECHRKIKVYGAKRDGFSEWHKGDSSHDWIAIEIKPLQLLSIQKKSFDDETTKLLLFSLIHCWLAEQTWQFLALAFQMIVKRHTKGWFSICRIHTMEVFGQRLVSRCGANF